MNVKRLLTIFKENIAEFSQDQLLEVSEVLAPQFKENGILKVPYGVNEILSIKTDDIYYVKGQKTGINTIYLSDREIPFNHPPYDLLEYILESNSDFRYINNGLIANRKKMKCYDSNFNKVFFINGASVVVTSGAINGVIKKELTTENDIAAEKNTLSGSFLFR